MKRARTRFYSPRFTKSFRRMNLILWAKISRRRRTNFLARADLKRSWTKWLGSRSASAFTILRSSRRKFSTLSAISFDEYPATVLVRLIDPNRDQQVV